MGWAGNLLQVIQDQNHFSLHSRFNGLCFHSPN